MKSKVVIYTDIYKHLYELHVTIISKLLATLAIVIEATTLDYATHS